MSHDITDDANQLFQLRYPAAVLHLEDVAVLIEHLSTHARAAEFQEVDEPVRLRAGQCWILPHLLCHATYSLLLCHTVYNVYI